jgi:putative restriction endonuclease
VNNSRGYWAVAKVADISVDPKRSDHYYAWIEPGSFLEFSSPVPRSINGSLVERDVRNSQWSVRPLSDSDFGRIVSLGLPEDDELLPRIGEADQSLREPAMGYDFGPRPQVVQLTSRPFRDRAFRSSVLRAYDERCALTGLKLINGGGRAEVQAAHIQPVASNGPDMVANGLALSGTVHLIFDRGLVSLADDLSILVSRHVNDRAGLEAILNRSGRAHLPIDPRERPHSAFLKWHRENCFKS